AHREAVRAALAELEIFAATRVHEAGTIWDRPTSNIVAALFEHETSRALDPHLHTHCIVFNATRDPAEERWKALQNYAMLSARKYVENVYYHELARALRLAGYTVINSARGDFRLAEVNEEICTRFSKRHQEIDEKTRQLLSQFHYGGNANINDVREHIAQNERSRKIRNVSRRRLRELWASQIQTSEELTIRGRSADDGAKEPRVIGAADVVTWAGEHLFDRRSVVR